MKRALLRKGICELFSAAMAENGETEAMVTEVKEEPQEAMETNETESEDTEHTEDYQKLIDYGINAKVANELDKIYKSGEIGPN